MKNVFITGISGLLGTNLAIDLLAQGFKVTALLRNKSTYQKVTHPNLLLIEGNLTDDWSVHLKNIQVFIHVAAETNPGLLNYSDYQKINVAATKHLYQSCRNYHVKRFIFISTANTMGFGSLDHPGNESKKIKPPFKNAGYAQSKLAAEKYLLAQKNNTDVIIINPTFMLGPYDDKPSSGKIILMGWKKKVIFYPPGGKNFVNVKEASQGIINSIELGKNGERYLIGNENLSFKEFFTQLNSITNQKPIMIPIPKWLLISLGCFGNLLRIIHIPTPLSLINTQMLCIHNYYDNSKSKQELNIHYNSIHKGIQEAVAYFSQSKTKT
jgi:nucleoside-diphosphate-sugar epimerase